MNLLLKDCGALTLTILYRVASVIDYSLFFKQQEWGKVTMDYFKSIHNNDKMIDNYDGENKMQ